MKILKALSISCLLGASVINSTTVANNNSNVTNFTGIPAKTVCIKNPNAADVNKFSQRLLFFLLKFIKC